jgi:hypothetical protein
MHRTFIVVLILLACVGGVFALLATYEADAPTPAAVVEDNPQMVSTLRPVTFCDRTYQSEVVMINDVDVVLRIAALATTNQMPTAPAGRIGEMLCKSMPGNTNVLETNIVQTGTTSRVLIGQQSFEINTETEDIYIVGGFAGDLTLVGKLR